jgi:cytochrome P450
MWTHWILNFFLPSSYKGSDYVRRAKALLIPEIERRERQNIAYQKPEEGLNLLSWMLEIARPEERNPADLAHLQVVMSLASIHTSQMNAVHVLYDLASRPEYVKPLREEIIQLIREEGSWKDWQKPAFSKLKKLDSFMKESQRVNPPSLLSYHRVMVEGHTMADGLMLPKGSHISMPVNAIQNDPDVTANPELFDGFRYYKLRQREGERHLHQFVTTQPTNLNFGHGKYACPGRFFASLEIKNILVRLIMDYDWKIEGDRRPPNLTAHEFIFPNPDANLLMKKRPSELLLDSIRPDIQL